MIIIALPLKGHFMYLFLSAIVMDKLTRIIQEEIYWCIQFTDDIILVVSEVDIGFKL